MTRLELAQACDRLGAYFGKTIPARQLDEWFRVLCHHDGGRALSGAVDRMVAECDAIPRNVPKVLAEYIGDWKAEHPVRTKPGERERCPECWMGSGFIFAYRGDDPELKYRYAVPCAACRPSARGAMTRANLEAMGYWIDVPCKFRTMERAG